MLKVDALAESQQMVYAGPATENEDQPRQRVFHKGRCIEYLCSGKSICTYIVGGYCIAASAALAYMMTDATINPDPDSLRGKINETVVDYMVFGGAAVFVDIALAALACAGAGLIIKRCYNGIKEGRVQRNRTPLLEEKE